MFFKIVEDFKEIIKDFEIKDYKRYGSAKAIVAKIEFIDNSVLHIKDYFFLKGKRKYSYHWQDEKGNLLIRWDNSPHHFHINTFPDHKHIKNEVVKSKETDLRAVMEIVNYSVLTDGASKGA